jgi:hypothetical protein
LSGRVEVLRSAVERREHSWPSIGLPGPLIVRFRWASNAEVGLISAGQRLRVAGTEEDAADARHAFHAAILPSRLTWSPPFEF